MDVPALFVGMVLFRGSRWTLLSLLFTAVSCFTCGPHDWRMKTRSLNSKLDLLFRLHSKRRKYVTDKEFGPKCDWLIIDDSFFSFLNDGVWILRVLNRLAVNVSIYDINLNSTEVLGCKLTAFLDTD